MEDTILEEVPYIFRSQGMFMICEQNRRRLPRFYVLKGIRDALCIRVCFYEDSPHQKPRTCEGRKSWEVEVKHASWIVEKILKAVQWLEEGLQVLEIMEAEEFNIK
uniref:Uncharacterized protein n=1 Tax=Solanum lycopersicum TaxID=4081 RepID=A0A3Q7H932_SOLLC